jgi:hypothetical protein
MIIVSVIKQMRPFEKITIFLNSILVYFLFPHKQRFTYEKETTNYVDGLL